MQIHVSLKGTLAEHLPGGAAKVEVADGATVQAVSDLFDLPGRHCVFVLNGATVKTDATLRDGDRLQAFPPMAGGSHPLGVCEDVRAAEPKIAVR